jgi:hypothetical protein
MRSPCSLCLYIPPINFWMHELIFMKLGMYIMTPEPISTAHFINPSHQSMCISLSLLGKGSVNTFPLNEYTLYNRKIVGRVVSVRSVFYRRRVCGSVYPIFLCMYRRSSCLKVPRAVRQWNAVMSFVGLGVKNHCAGEGPKQFTVCPTVVARQRLGKQVPAAKKDCWRRRFLCGPCCITGK